MASVSDLINLNRYASGDFGREGLNRPPAPYKSQNQVQSEDLQIKNLIADLAIRQHQQAIEEKKRQLWESVGLAGDKNKTTSGITSNIVDKEQAGGRDIIAVGSSKKPDAESGYEAAVSKSGNMYLRAKDEEQESKPYDRVKVFNRAMKLIDADLLTEGISKSTMKASDYSARLKKMIPQAEIDLYGDNQTPLPESPSYTSQDEDNRPVNPTGLTSDPEDFLPEYKEKRGMIGVAKDFYFGKKDKQGAGVKATSGKVMIQTPDGKRGYIPQANLQKAISRGAKLVQ